MWAGRKPSQLSVVHFLFKRDTTGEAYHAHPCQRSIQSAGQLSTCQVRKIAFRTSQITWFLRQTCVLR